MNKDELLLKAAANMRRPCSAGVMIDKRVLLSCSGSELRKGKSLTNLLKSDNI